MATVERCSLRSMHPVLRYTAIPVIAIGILLVVAEMSTSEIAVKSRSNVGFFQFDRYSELNADYLKKAPVRLGVAWQLFEPQRGEFIFDGSNKQAAQIDAYVRSGYTIIPSIRSKSTWATEPATQVLGERTKKNAGKGEGKEGIAADCSSAPLDMDTIQPLREGESYSASYYRFIRTFAERYKGKISIVVIENEINDPIPGGGDWCSSVDKYLRLLLTAKKAFRDVDPEVQIADGAIQPRPLMWLTIDDDLRSGNTKAALHLYALMEGEKIDEKELRAKTNAAFHEPRVSRAKEFIDARLYEWADIGNIHFVQAIDALPELLSYLQKNAPVGKYFMSDMFGATNSQVNDGKQAAKEIIIRTARLLALRLSPIILMSIPGNDRLATALVDMDGQVRPLNVHAFEAAARFLGDVLPASAVDTSTDKRWSYQFQSPGGTVEVLWSKNGEPVKVNARSNCNVFDYQQKSLRRTSTITPDAAPIFIVCGSSH